MVFVKFTSRYQVISEDLDQYITIHRSIFINFKLNTPCSYIKYIKLLNQCKCFNYVCLLWEKVAEGIQLVFVHGMFKERKFSLNEQAKVLQQFN